MLTREQMDAFRVFGFLVIREAFTPEEMERIAHEAERVWEAYLGRPAAPDEPLGIAPFLELNPRLLFLIEDDRIYIPMTQLLGQDVIWSGSEGNQGIAGGRAAHHWHADRPGPLELGYTRIKIILYMDPMRKDTGALRVIPGSHRSPFHEALEPFQIAHVEADPRFFGMNGADVPAYPVETDPGDVVVFNQSLFHAVYGHPDRRRRFIALKYAARPTTPAHLASLRRGSQYTFTPHEALRLSESPRLRGLIDGLAELGQRAAQTEGAV
jgi:hypothetical protein